MMARFCEYCGSELQEGALICSQCGSIQSNDVYAQQEVPQSVQTPYATQYAEQAYPQYPQYAEQEAVQQPLQEAVTAPVKKKSKKKWLIPVAVVAAVVAAGALLWQPILKMISPHAYVAVMMKNTNSDLQDRMEGTPAGILASSSDCMDDGSLGIDVSYTDEELGDMSANVTLSSDVEEKKWEIKADVSVMDVTADFKAYVDSNAFAIGSDALTGGNYYGITYSTFAEDIKSSVFGDMLDDEDTEMLTTLVDAVDTTIDTAANIEERLEPYMNVLTEYVKGLEAKNGSEKIELDGKQRNCSTVAFTVNQDDLVNMLGDMLDILEKEPEFEGLIVNLDIGETSDIMDTLRDGLDQINEAIDAEATVTYYVYNSNVVDVKVAIQIENPDGDEKIEVVTDVCFGANPKKSDIIVQCTVNAMGEKVNVKAVYSDAWDGDDFKSTCTVVVKNDGEKVAELEQETKWNKESGKLTISAGVEDEKISCTLKLVEKDNGFTISIEDMYAFICELDPSFDEEEFDCSVKVTFTEGVSISTPTFINLDKIDEEALQGIMESVQNFVSESEEAFGSFGASVENGETVYPSEWE